MTEQHLGPHVHTGDRVNVNRGYYRGRRGTIVGMIPPSNDHPQGAAWVKFDHEKGRSLVSKVIAVKALTKDQVG